MSESVMIVAGETSGELYGSLLAGALRKNKPGLRIIGIGGERMKAAGVELVAGISSAFGIAEAVSSLRDLKKTYRKAVEVFEKVRPRVVVLIDYPDFNLKLAKEARKHQILILYYVSPQVWAWRKKRVKKIARLVDKMAVVLPFEERLYSDTGLACEFVGHPVCDEIEAMESDKGKAKKALGFVDERPLLALLPGSRPSELSRHLPVILNVVKEFRREFPSFQFAIPVAPNTDLHPYRHLFDELGQEGVMIHKNNSLNVLAASDMAVVTSGTATLQAGLLGIPMVVIYKLFPLTFWLGKMIVKVDHISLVNILSGKGVIRELLQSEATTENILQELKLILTSPAHRNEMFEAYTRIRDMFRGKKASERVAEMVMDLAGWKQATG